MGLHGYVPMPMIENLVQSRVLKARRKGGGGGGIVFGTCLDQKICSGLSVSNINSSS